MKIFLQNQCMSLEEADFSGIEHNRNRRSIRGDDEITSEPWPILKPFRGSVGSGIIPNRIGQHGSRVNDGFYYKHKHTGTEDAQHVCMRMTAIQRLDCEEGEKRRGGGGKATRPHPFPIYACNIGYRKFACVQSHTYRRTLSLGTRITTSARKTETFALLVQ